MSDLYHTDPYKWLTEQVSLLADRRFDELDLDNLLEELELSLQDKVDRLASELKTLIQHSLKMEYQTTVLRESVATGRVLRKWKGSIRHPRTAIEMLLAGTPSLYQQSNEALAIAYPNAKKDAIKEMNDHLHKSQHLNEDSFPNECPWSFDKLMETEWYPLNGVEIQ
ncbi:DUF29 domain-containing protein [Endozoicomonas sp. ONNA1]|uniref:DUF29 domain-containing protein n=1 Tax=Endozoicomonas sp. ONNA1 TaxID=2828740 RepID=UPI00214939F0|nr:DUF29 domain-containing protein [Endozoicomonas sp. ONNA1]